MFFKYHPMKVTNIMNIYCNPKFLLCVCKLVSHLINVYSLDSRLVQFHTFHCHKGILVQTDTVTLIVTLVVLSINLCFMFLRIEREYETGGVEQLVPGTHPDR